MADAAWFESGALIGETVVGWPRRAQKVEWRQYRQAATLSAQNEPSLRQQISDIENSQSETPRINYPFSIGTPTKVLSGDRLVGSRADFAETF
jgi:hypothetical protein